MNKKVYETVKETLYYDVLPSGLKVYMVPKQGYQKTYVTLSTPLGSTTTQYIKNGVVLEIPSGIAHFLEHKLFEQDGKDVSEEFALNGANVNAFTMNNKTTYLFHTTSNLIENIRILLNFVFQPTFTVDGVETEKPIIEQEISMYEDDSNTVIYMNVLRNMYEHHPVREEILGTRESIYRITKSLLEDVHQTYYHPENMILFITGNFVPEEIYEALLKMDPAGWSNELQPVFTQHEEADGVTCVETSKAMDVMVPNALLGIKLPIPHQTMNILRYELIASIVMDLLIGKSTENFAALLEKGYINDTFGVDVTIDKDYGYLLIGSQTKHPNELKTEIMTMISEAKSQGVDVKQYQRTKKLIIGNFIQALNSLEYIANQFTKYYFLDADLFEILTVADTITFEDILAFIRVIDQPSRCTYSVIMPK